jgi:hypothetical protein
MKGSVKVGNAFFRRLTAAEVRYLAHNFSHAVLDGHRSEMENLLKRLERRMRVDFFALSRATQEDIHRQLWRKADEKRKMAGTGTENPLRVGDLPELLIAALLWPLHARRGTATNGRRSMFFTKRPPGYKYTAQRVPRSVGPSRNWRIAWRQWILPIIVASVLLLLSVFVLVKSGGEILLAAAVSTPAHTLLTVFFCLVIFRYIRRAVGGHHLLPDGFGSFLLLLFVVVPVTLVLVKCDDAIDRGARTLFTNLGMGGTSPATIAKTSTSSFGGQHTIMPLATANWKVGTTIFIHDPSDPSKTLYRETGRTFRGEYLLVLTHTTVTFSEKFEHLHIVTTDANSKTGKPVSVAEFIASCVRDIKTERWVCGRGVDGRAIGTWWMRVTPKVFKHGTFDLTFSAPDRARGKMYMEGEPKERVDTIAMVDVKK